MTVFEFEKAMAISHAKTGAVIPSFFASQEYRYALSSDLIALPADSTAEDNFFERHSVPQQLLVAGVTQQSIIAWENCLHSIKFTDPGRFERMHKGTPYYFIAVASYIMEDFEKAFFFMDCAVAEDHHVHGTNWRKTPAGCFVCLDDNNPNQFAKRLNSQTKSEVTSALSDIMSLGGTSLSLQQLRDKLLTPAIDSNNEFRSAVTALFTFILEYKTRYRKLNLASSHGGSSEPFYLHLFKGGLIFETLLKVSADGRNLHTRQGRQTKRTIDTYLKDNVIKAKLGLPTQFNSMGNISFDQVITRINYAVTNNDPFNERAILTTWGLRNTTGHSLEWTSRPKSDEYKMLFCHQLGAIFHTIDCLY